MPLLVELLVHALSAHPRQISITAIARLVILRAYHI
jgi:hypothetical protein